MAERPKRHAATNRPTTDQLLDHRKRRTTAQVQQEKIDAARATAEAAQSEQALRTKKQTHIAAIEDQLREEDRLNERFANRPDQQITAKRGRKVTAKVNTQGQHITGHSTTFEDHPDKDLEPVDQQGALAKVSHQVLPAKASVAASGGPHAVKERTNHEEADSDVMDARSDSSEGSVLLASLYKAMGESEVLQAVRLTKNSPNKNHDDITIGQPAVPESEPPKDIDQSYYYHDFGLFGDAAGSGSDDDGDYVAGDPMDKSSSGDDDLLVDDATIQVEAVKKSKKPQRGDFRQEVDAKRKTIPAPGTGKVVAGGSQKRKEPSLDRTQAPVNVSRLGKDSKRAKHDESGGLLPGWKAALAKDRSSQIAVRNLANSNPEADEPGYERDPMEYAGGQFDVDEPSEVIMAVREMKSEQSAISGTRGFSKNTVKIVEPAPTVVPEHSASSRSRIKKEKYTLASLPFDRDEATALIQTWRKSFKPTLIQWAATLEDPFGSNSLMDDIIEDIWKRIFPDIAITAKSRPAIIDVAGDVLIDWRSAMGKEALRVVVQAFRNLPGVSQANAPHTPQTALKDYLNDSQFVYLDSKGRKSSEKGAFLSNLLTSVFAFYLKKATGSVIEWGPPVGALAVATAVTERALELIRSNHINIDTFGSTNDEIHDIASNGRKRRAPTYPGYTERLWGSKTRGWVGSTRRLNAEKWANIIATANAKVDFSSMDDGEDEDGYGGPTDPRGMIDI
ncbi:hypothetical protein BD779DRAFT_1805320 [Infundibulicybe gibba]|nr:hypothetical protein BD779DRAFT_1805320 [Infundibulicybe gibba]